MNHTPLSPDGPAPARTTSINEEDESEPFNYNFQAPTVSKRGSRLSQISKFSRTKRPSALVDQIIIETSHFNALQDLDN